MRKGFTIIELLVASLLLGMLVTILTMIFNQSSIAWRIGAASESNMDQLRRCIAEVREEADNAFVWNGKLYYNVGLWREDGKLRDRACNAPNSAVASDVPENSGILNGFVRKNGSTVTANDFSPVPVGMISSASGPKNNYTVNVKSAGPDRVFDTYDDIWSWPDDFE